MHRYLRAAVVAALMPMAALAAAPAADADLDPGKEHDACMEKAGGVTANMVSCITAEYEREDKRLNDAYAALRGRLAEARHTGLRDAQRAWLSFRDLNCEFRVDPDGGTMARVSANQCMLTMTTDRADELEGLERQP